MRLQKTQGLQSKLGEADDGHVSHDRYESDGDQGHEGRKGQKRGEKKAKIAVKETAKKKNDDGKSSRHAGSKNDEISSRHAGSKNDEKMMATIAVKGTAMKAMKAMKAKTAVKRRR